MLGVGWAECACAPWQYTRMRCCGRFALRLNSRLKAVLPPRKACSLSWLFLVVMLLCSGASPAMVQLECFVDGSHITTAQVNNAAFPAAFWELWMCAMVDGSHITTAQARSCPALDSELFHSMVGLLMQTCAHI